MVPVAKWKSLRKLYDRQYIFVNCYRSSISQMTTYIFSLSFRSTWARPRFSTINEVRVVHDVKLYHSISSVLWCQLLFLCEHVVRFVSTPSSFVGDSCCYISYLWCIMYTGVQHDFMLSDFCSFIPMFALMLVCVTSDLEVVPSVWYKHIHL